MAPAKWYASDGVGLSKKHDAPGLVHHARISRPFLGGLRRKRLLLIIAGVIVLYFFVKNIPTDLPPVGQRYSPRFGALAPGHIQAQYEMYQNRGKGNKQPDGHGYEGSILFQNLATSLRPHMSWFSNQNVLFALPDLSSTSKLVPVACQMAQYNRSSVHVALLGRQNIKIQDILKIHGISAGDCPVFWHDARPDRLAESSEGRIEASIQSGFAHCCNALRPQAVIADEDIYTGSVLGDLLRSVATSAGTPVVTLPGHAHQSLSWIATLDSDSLLKLKEVEIDIVVQAYAESAGPLLRLLRSLAAADYSGLSPPRLTIELPARVDPLVLQHLEWFSWPPGSLPSESRLTLRRRTDTKRPKVSDASLHTIESYYPRTATKSHLLILSPDAELSPSYLHYLMFMLLEYRYSRSNTDFADSLFGIALELPDKRFDGHSSFLNHISSSQNDRLVMSQTPNANAALIMGDKWADLRSLLALRLTRDPDLTQTSDSATAITNQHSHWIREALDLMQVQRLYMLYPAFATNRNMKLVTMHHELHQGPEEYVPPETSKDESKILSASDIMHDDVLTGDVDLPRGNDNAMPVSASLPMQVLLSRDPKTSQQILPRLASIPLFTFDGEATDWVESHAAAQQFADRFSMHQGGCKSLEARTRAGSGSIARLFCEVG